MKSKVIFVIKNMIGFIKRHVSNQTFYRFKRGYYYIRYFGTYLTNDKKKIKRYPKTIQLPITYACNFDCIMCGMRNLLGKKSFSPQELGQILNDKLYHKVESVGINGGEPFLRNDIDECVQIIADSLPNLKYFHFISNGYYTDKILEKLKKIKKICVNKNIKLNISFSVDGIGDMQSFMRGNQSAWSNVVQTIEKINEDRSLYCDYMNVICTITKYNIYRVLEVEVWSKKYNLDVAYNIATENVRIDNFDKYKDFTIFNDETARKMTAEFFYRKYLLEKSQRYFGIYLFVRYRKRFAPCDSANADWVTLTPDGQIGYCATHSKNLGNTMQFSSYKIFDENKYYLKELTETYCETCSHYIYKLSAEGKRLFFKENIKNSEIN